MLISDKDVYETFGQNLDLTKPTFEILANKQWANVQLLNPVHTWHRNQSRFNQPSARPTRLTASLSPGVFLEASSCHCHQYQMHRNAMIPANLSMARISPRHVWILIGYKQTNCRAKTLHVYTPMHELIFFGHRPNVFLNDGKKVSLFGQNLRKYRLVNTVTASFNTMRQMT